MLLTDLPRIVPDFARLTHVERVKIICWHLHTSEKKEWLATADVRSAYENLHMDVPNIADILIRLSAKSPKVLLRRRQQYKLEMRVRSDLDAKYGNRPITIAVEESLAALPARLIDETKRKYLSEALTCLQVKCFRAAILMTWNLAYDHFVNWLLADSARLAKINSKLPSKPPFSIGLIIAKREDFEWFNERELIELSGHKDVAVIPGNVKKILIQCLDRRNMSAHPATIEITQVNAEDTISSLVENVVLRLT